MPYTLWGVYVSEEEESFSIKTSNKVRIEVKHKITVANKRYFRLSVQWRIKVLSRRTKEQLYTKLIISVLLSDIEARTKTSFNEFFE